MQKQNFVWLPFSRNRNAVVNLNHIGPRFDEKKNRWVGYNANCESEYICLPISHPYTEAELDHIGELVVATLDPLFKDFFRGCPQRALCASRADVVTEVIAQFEKTAITC
jgi:hypothetical protein